MSTHNKNVTLYFLWHMWQITLVITTEGLPVFHSIKDVQHLFHEDVDLPFLESFCIAIAWEYDLLFEELKADDRLPGDLKNTEFSVRRSNCAIRALSQACRKHDREFRQWKLECNGQVKIMAKMGRVLLIQEPIAELLQKPIAADYKVALANSFGISRQLELDLGDKPARVLDWSGEVLAVLLHGAAGPAFTRRDKTLGGLMLAVPDDRYENWIARFDLHDMAMFGVKATSASYTAPEGKPIQRDEVIITPKRKNRNIGTLK